MKLVFTADTHFGSKFKDGGAAARTAEHIACFSRMAEKARSLGAPVLIGGDLFDSPYPAPETEAAVRRVFETHADVAFYAVAGNHDPLGATAFYADPPENLHVFPDRVECVELGGVSYEEAAQRLFAAEEWVESQDWTGKETPCAVQVALERLRKGE